MLTLYMVLLATRPLVGADCLSQQFILEDESEQGAEGGIGL
jgi:hypothetical protein